MDRSAKNPRPPPPPPGRAPHSPQRSSASLRRKLRFRAAAAAPRKLLRSLQPEGLPSGRRCPWASPAAQGGGGWAGIKSINAKHLYLIFLLFRTQKNRTAVRFYIFKKHLLFFFFNRSCNKILEKRMRSVGT